MGYQIGTDIGGTCTDSVIMSDNGEVYLGKTLTTYDDFSKGILNSISDAADDAGKELNELLAETDLFFHATSVGENALFEREGATTGLVTTEGFGETLHARRGGYGRWSGLPFEKVKDIINTEKPQPVVPKERISEVAERSYRDKKIKSINENEIREAVDNLVETGIESIGVCFLWSFSSPEHEKKVKRIVQKEYPDLHVAASHEIVAEMGEYERTATTALSAYLGPVVEDYLLNLKSKLQENGFSGALLIMFAHGGLVMSDDAVTKPVGLIESGPVAGLMGSKFVANNHGIKNLISTDMGGTTFKVGVIRDGIVEYADEPMIKRHHYKFPKRDIHSIAVAGGSVISIDEKTGLPSVGPESAGSDPGPICYGKGGKQPTVTDVDLIQGYFSPDHFLDGGHDMEPELAREIFNEKVAKPLDKSVNDAAAGIYRLVNSSITDLLREMTVQKGIDPREYTIVSIGGAAGMHVTSYARDLGVKQVLVPQTASVNSALGLLSTDVTHEFSETINLQPPFRVEKVNQLFDNLEAKAQQKLENEGFSPEEQKIERSIGFRYQGQVHELLTPVRSEGSLTVEDFNTVIDRFEDLYEKRYGEGSAFKQGGIETTGLRVRGIGSLSTPSLSKADPTESKIAHAKLANKEMRFQPVESSVKAEVYDFRKLSPRDKILGPSVIVTPITTVVINPGDIAEIDSYRNIQIDINVEEDWD